MGHPTENGYDSFDSYAKTGVTSIKADVKTIKFTINKVAYTSTTGTTTGSVAIHTCRDVQDLWSEAGFEVKGKITAPSHVAIQKCCYHGDRLHRIGYRASTC